MLEVLGIHFRLHEYNFPLNIFYGRYMYGGFLMAVIRHVHSCFGCSFEIFLVYNYAMFPFAAFTYDEC